jgi:hypothetical protein
MRWQRFAFECHRDDAWTTPVVDRNHEVAAQYFVRTRAGRRIEVARS